MSLPQPGVDGTKRRPFLPQELDEPCEGCFAPAGSYCHPGCDCGYTAEDARADAARG